MFSGSISKDREHHFNPFQGYIEVTTFEIGKVASKLRVPLPQKSMVFESWRRMERACNDRTNTKHFADSTYLESP
jgi:hypothetical protein